MVAAGPRPLRPRCPNSKLEAGERDAAGVAGRAGGCERSLGPRGRFGPPRWGWRRCAVLGGVVAPQPSSATTLLVEWSSRFFDAALQLVSGRKGNTMFSIREHCTLCQSL